MSKREKDREPESHPTLDPLKAEDPLVFRSSDSLLKFESVQEFAQYLRENQEIDQCIFESLKQKLDKGELRIRYSRRGRPNKKEPQLPMSGPKLADCFDPPPGSRFWIEPAGRRRRLRKSSQRARQRAICSKIEEALVTERGKVHLAVERVGAETGLSKSTIYRAWKTRKR